MLARLKWLLLGLLIFVPGPPGRCEGVAPTLRVGLLQGAPEFAFAGPQGLSVLPLRGDQPLAAIPAGETWKVQQAGPGLALVNPAGQQIQVAEHSLRLVPPDGATITAHGIVGHWDKHTDRDYRGLLEVTLSGGGFTVVNVVDVETYLRGVVSSEMPATYPLAALQAQAIAARGQALMKAGRHRSNGFDLCSGQHCQVYGGATIEDPRSDQAVTSTAGLVLTYHGRLADTLYSSTCGGHTADNEEYWPGSPSVPYLRGVPDFEPEDKVNCSFPMTEQQIRAYLKYAPPVHCNQPGYAQADKIRWWSLVRRSDLEKTLREDQGDFGSLLDVRILDRSPSGLVRRIAIVGSKRLVRVQGGSAVRHALGGLNSASFAVEPILDDKGLAVAFAIWGAGWGHQVGMCQVGAAGLADRGWGYEQILSKYYGGCKVEKRY